MNTCDKLNTSIGTTGKSTPELLTLSDDYKDIIQVNKYSPAIREIVAKILKAISIFDCYDLKVMEMREFFTEGSAFSTAVFDALRSLKKSQHEYTKAVSHCLTLLRDMEKGFRSITDIETGFDSNGPCFVNGEEFSEEDCKKCENATPSFKTKYKAKLEMRFLVLQIQENIPKQFLLYASNIYIITAEAIRIIDKILTCHEERRDKCDSRDSLISRFTKKLEGLVRKEEAHVVLIRSLKIKIHSLMEQLEVQVQSSMKFVSNCLTIKKESKSASRNMHNGYKEKDFNRLKKDLEMIASKYGLVFDDIKSEDIDRFTVTLHRPHGKQQKPA
ncbi:hypothetical protein GE061_019944 [Apolygus lucorum]|uniref:Uncharacterized protein n=1 Tax=Apolygus lucorum TaxID=248454 RepID=A0A6A4JM59_APOLU|nr:hypothetical protein GE061_019944 [Apolygus lucorum]